MDLNAPWNLDLTESDTRVKDFFEWTQFPNVTNPLFPTYKAENNYESPLYQITSQCLQANSFLLPQVESPVIAAIGPYEPGDLTDLTLHYLGNWDDTS